MAQATRVELANLVGDIVSASLVPAKRRGTSIRPTVDKFASQAYDQGILGDVLAELLDLVTTPSHLDQASLNAIAKNLYPASRLSGDAVLKVVGCLGHGELKPSLPIQSALLRWLIMVYHVLEHPAVLSQSYAVLFNLLDTAAIRPQLCHLLALITRRKHVRPFRIQAVLNLSRQTGNDPALTGLLRIYKDYYPEIIVGEAVRGKASAFKHPDLQWRTRLDEIQEAHHQNTDAANGTDQDAFRVSRQGIFARRGVRGSAIPSVRTSHATENSITLEEVEGAEKFVANLERIELPNQLAAVLADPLLQKLVLLRPSQESNQRIGNWISAAIRDIISGEADDHFIRDVLTVLQDYVAKMKILPPIILDFFAEFVLVWNGLEARDAVLDILSHTPLLNFDKLYQRVFQPLESCVLNNSPDSQVLVLKLYTKLLRHWKVLLRSSESILSDATEAVAKLFEHTNKLALTIVQTYPTVSAHGAILDFYEETAAVVSDPVLRQYVQIIIPSAQLVYTLFFSHSVMTVSRLCYVLACYKRGFQIAMAKEKPSDRATPAIDSSTYARVYVDFFNGFLMDICNCLWRSRAFNRTDVNALGCRIPQASVAELSSYMASLNTGVTLSSLFALSNSPTLCLLSILCVRELEDTEIEKGAISVRHPGPVTQDSLARNASAGGLKLTWQEYRITVVKALEASDLGGISVLLKNTMKILMNSKDDNARGSRIRPMAR